MQSLKSSANTSGNIDVLPAKQKEKDMKEDEKKHRYNVTFSEEENRILKMRMSIADYATPGEFFRAIVRLGKVPKTSHNTIKRH